MKIDTAELLAHRRAERRYALIVAALSVLVGSVLYTSAAQAAACEGKKDFLVSADPLMASVRPVDCSHVYQPAADFAWPAQKGAEQYVITLTHPDGREETRLTTANWFAWDAKLAPGTYTWRLSAVGRQQETSAPRTFTVDPAA